ncbi:hypothetical protein [Belnapia sp. F-4-1]|uniref:hypothetical protein n=1 Tax=Belnapia sp. F-4-1 TaxID=1545443 RepID=UPI0005BE185B|nr:hypothetical protein [Belnapia sp. F-4-1]
MTEKKADGTSTAGQDQTSRERPEAAVEWRKEGGRSSEETDPSILTPGGNVRYGGGNAQGVPMAPDSEDSK